MINAKTLLREHLDSIHEAVEGERQRQEESARQRRQAHRDQSERDARFVRFNYIPSYLDQALGLEYVYEENIFVSNSSWHFRFHFLGYDWKIEALRKDDPESAFYFRITPPAPEGYRCVGLNEFQSALLNLLAEYERNFKRREPLA